VFGFSGNKLETLRRQAMASSEEPNSPAVLTGICVLDQGLVLPIREDGQVAIEDIQGYVAAETASGDGAWGLFLGHVWRALQMVAPARPNLTKYIGLGEMLDDPYPRPPEAA
jgi:hypothetical protein